MSPSPAELADAYGTPLFVYDLDEVDRAYADLRAALPPASRLYYSVKANPHPDVVARLSELGCRLEVSSGGEIAAALAAVPPSAVLFTGPGKSPQSVHDAVAAGVTHFSVESPVDLGRVDIAARAHGVVATCTVRVNADEPVGGGGLAMTGSASQFGSDLSWVLAEPQRFADRTHTRIVGLHLYMATGLATTNDLVEQFRVGLDIASRLRSVLSGVEEIDLGGGFGAAYARSGERLRFDDLSARLEPLLDEHVPDWQTGVPRIAFESGRYLTAGAGTLVARVLDVKASKGRTYVVLDTGVHHLGGMSGLRRIPQVGAEIDQPDAGSAQSAVLAGPLCTPLDILARDTPVGELAPGDIVTVPHCGAYGPTAGLLGFLSHPCPAEAVLDRGAVRGVTRLHLERHHLSTREPTTHEPTQAGTA